MQRRILELFLESDSGHTDTMSFFKYILISIRISLKSESQEGIIVVLWRQQQNNTVGKEKDE
jgi:hypothetical protein